MLNTFRKHNKVILATLGVMLMLGWLIFPALDDLLFKGNRSAQADPVAVTWKGGRLTVSELRHLQHLHGATLRFIQMVMQETQNLGGTPKAPGYFFLNPQQGIIGINPSVNEGSLLETIILAQRAKELGVRVNDESVKNFLLFDIGDRSLKEGDLAELLRKAVPEGGTSVTQGAIFEHLKTELLAQQMRLMVNAGIDSLSPGDITPAGMPVRLMFGGDRGALPPGEMWKVYEKLNRRVQIEAYPVHAKDYENKVTEKPSDKELQELYEQGRKRLPSPMESEPAFRQPFRAAFAYVNLELTPFLEEAKKEVKEEAIVAEYEKGKAAGRFKVEEAPPAEKPADKPAEPGTEKPADDKPADDKPAEGDKPADDKKPADKPAEDKPAEDKPAEKPAEPKPADAKPEETKPEEGKPAEPKPNEGAGRLSFSPQFVNFQEDEKKKADDKPAEAKEPEAKPAEAKTDDPAAGDPAKPEAKPESKPADPAAKPGEETKPETKPEIKPGEEAKPGEETKPAATPEVKFKPLEEVREEIITQLARPIAADKRTEVVNKIMAAVNEFGRKYNRWKIYQDRDAQPAAGVKPRAGKNPEKPEPLDMVAITGDSKIKLQSVPLVDPFEIAEQVDEPQPDGEVKNKAKFPIASAFRFDGQNFASFGEFAFEPNAGLYFADTLPFPRSVGSSFMGGGGENLWIYWRTEEEKAKERTFDEAKEDVVKYWQRKQALKIAEEAARKLSEQAAKGAELKTIVPNAKDVVTPPAFSWLTSGSVGGQFARPLPSQVEGVPFVGDDFRQSVFDLKVGESSIALDEPETTVWVVRLVGEEGDLSRDRFLEKVHDQEFLIAAWQSQLPLQNAIYEQMFEKYDIKWTPNVLEGGSDE